MFIIRGEIMEVIKKAGRVLWNNKRLLFIFVFSFLIYEFIAYPNNNGDPIAMYAFSHAIKMGEVPYRDFNIIATPLYAFLMSIGLFIFDNYLMFILEQSLLVTILFYFLFKMYDKKAWFILFGMCFVQYFGFIPTYNFLCLFFIVILIYLEKKYSYKDYLVGFILALAFLSKQTVGVFLVLVTVIICFKDIKKLFKRAVGFSIPCLILIIYLIINEAMYDFINLAFLGMFDFGNNNSNFDGMFFWLSLLFFGVMIITLFAKRKDKYNYNYNYYLLCGFVFCIPLFDFPHLGLFFTCFCILIVDYVDVGNRLNYYSKLCIAITMLFSFLHFLCVNSLGATFFKELNHFQYMYSYKSDYDYNLKINKFLDKYNDKNTIMLSGYTMFYDIIRDRNINYFDVLLYGNHGYNGTKLMIDKIKGLSDFYIIVDYRKYETSDRYSQYNKKIVDHVINNYQKIERKYNFDVYYKR